MRCAFCFWDADQDANAKFIVLGERYFLFQILAVRTGEKCAGSAHNDAAQPRRADADKVLTGSIYFYYRK